jgi:hypothetical protein
MKTFGPAYQWEDSDGPVTVEKVWQLGQNLVRNDHARLFDDWRRPPVLILAHKQESDLKMDPAILGHVDWSRPPYHIDRLFGFKIIIAAKENQQ